MEPLIRLHLDEHVSSAIANGLRLRGIDVTTTAEANLLGAPDSAHLEWAIQENRAIFSEDADFLRMAASGTTHPGIIHAPHGSPVGPIVRDLVLICFVISPDELANQVIYIPF